MYYIYSEQRNTVHHFQFYFIPSAKCTNHPNSLTSKQILHKSRKQNCTRSLGQCSTIPVLIYILNSFLHQHTWFIVTNRSLTDFWWPSWPIEEVIKLFESGVLKQEPICNMQGCAARGPRLGNTRFKGFMSTGWMTEWIGGRLWRHKGKRKNFRGINYFIFWHKNTPATKQENSENGKEPSPGKKKKIVLRLDWMMTFRCVSRWWKCHAHIIGPSHNFYKQKVEK